LLYAFCDFHFHAFLSDFHFHSHSEISYLSFCYYASSTGASLAGALADSNDMVRRIKIKIVEAQNNILPGWDKRIISMATKSLLSNNIEIIVEVL
jgi:hypothetical protein